MKKDNYFPIIGLEVHIELRTLSKMFCGCPTEHFAKPPNTQTCPVCLGLPGALPVPNKKAVDWTIMLGLALNCQINKESKFDRKHYFYPDLPKGYQISQYDEPLATNGSLEFPIKRVRIRRVHIEEDTGKLQHTKLNGENVTLVDFNRSGVPLVEIVTEPDIRSASEAKEFAQELQRIIRYLGISDCDMEKGSMRLEANVSVAKFKSQRSKVKSLPDYKVEVKNINSFRFLEKAIEYEIKRQSELLARGEKIRQETRGWDEAKAVTVAQRYKEKEADYRYFPEPDIPPMIFSENQISDIKNQIPELPATYREKLIKDFKLPQNYAEILIQEKEMANLFEKSAKLGRKLNIEVKLLADLIVNKKVKVKSPEDLLKLAKEISTKIYSSEAEVEKVVEEVIKNETKAVEDYKKGKEQVIGFLIGQVQKKLKGKGNPGNISDLLRKNLL